MSKPIILARSPFLIDVSEVGSIGSRVEIFIKGVGGTYPLNANYILSKKTARPTDVTTQYDIAPYVRDFIRETGINTVFEPLWDFNITNGYPYNYCCQVLIKRYNTTTTGTEYITDGDLEYYAFDGYLKSSDDLGAYRLGGLTLVMSSYFLGTNNATYYYPSYSRIYGGMTGYIVITNGNGKTIRYEGSETADYLIETDDPIYIRLLATDAYENGNTLKIFNDDFSIYQELDVLPNCITKYTTYRLDFVNRYGIWQQSFFYGANRQTLNAKSDEYLLMQNVYPYPNINLPPYNYKQRQIFNRNGIVSTQLNTDWVSESWNKILSEIMMSENMILTTYDETQDTITDGLQGIISYPVKLNTNSIQLNKHINDKLINYTLEFEYLSPIVNNII